MAGRSEPEPVAPGVHVITLGRGPLASNVYLVESGRGWALVDTGWPDSAGEIRAAVASLFGPGSRPAAILLTHVHPDHSGSAYELARSWDRPVHAHAAELPQAAGGILPGFANPLDRFVLAPLLRLLPRPRHPDPLAGVVRALDPGGEVPGLPGWRYIPTPGHTPGHVAFFRSADRVLLTGDAVLTVDPNSPADLLLRRHRIAGPPWIATWDRPTAERSITRLAALGPDVLAPGHGRPMTGPGTAAALAAFARRLDHVPAPAAPLRSQHVVAHARCPVVVVRPPAQAEEPAPAVHLSPTTEPGGLS